MTSILAAVGARPAVLALSAVALAGCHRDVERDGGRVRIRAGAVVIAQAACGSCHVVPGIEEADGMVGPPLRHIASRQMIAGVTPNTPDNLVRFIRSPRSVVKGSVMPDQALSDEQLRDVVAYLETLD